MEEPKDMEQDEIKQKEILEQGAKIYRQEQPLKERILFIAADGSVSTEFYQVDDRYFGR